MDDLKQLVVQQKEKFENLANGRVSFSEEALFAVQAMTNNSYLASTARKDPDATKMAILNIAAVGLTLNPIKRQAYLIPRDNKVKVDISYMGMIQLATESGSIKWCEAQIVYEKDFFEIQRAGERPTHQFKPFEDRGKKIGAYCVAKVENDYLTTVMSIADIYKIRDKSQSFRAGKNSPWITDEDEMVKKTVIKRAFKTWPICPRTQKGLDLINEADPVDHNAIIAEVTGKQVEELRAMLSECERQESDLVEYVNLVHNCETERLSDFSENMYQTAKKMLIQTLESKGKK